MAYIIAEPCIGTKDTACVDGPVWIIRRKAAPMTMAARRCVSGRLYTFDEMSQLYIDPTECIDCGACVPVCPVTAIFALDDLPEKWNAYIEIDKNYVDAGRFQPDKYQETSS